MEKGFGYVEKAKRRKKERRRAACIVEYFMNT